MQNYANWELTKLLPEAFNELAIWICSDKKVRVSSVALSWIKEKFGEVWKQHYKDHLKIAWDWEDIRIYLLDKGFEISIFPSDFRHDSAKKLYSVRIYVYESRINETDTILLEDFESYESARNTSINHCLNLIKHDERNYNQKMVKEKS
jgi:hypothetical protein